MIDLKDKVRRYIAEYSEHTEELLNEYDLSGFDLEKFQIEFGESDTESPMFYCYSIKEVNVSFLKAFIDKEPVWDFKNKSYFIQAHAI